MKRLHTIILLLCLALYSAYAQDYNQLNDDGTFVAANSKQFGRSDSIQSKHKEIPKGFHTWTIDSRYGDRTMVEPDTASYMFMNSIYTSGVKGEYNFLGNLGSPRYSRIFIDNPEAENFIFTEPYSYFMKPIDDFHFTNTYSPITNLTFNTCGDRTNGEDHLTASYSTISTVADTILTKARPCSTILSMALISATDTRLISVLRSTIRRWRRTVVLPTTGI